MTYLVTGGTGLIGSRIVRDLVRQGDQVVVYDWLPARSSLKRLMSEDEIGSMVKIVQGEITDLPHLFRTIKESNVEKIIHTASLQVLDSNANPFSAVKVNCEGTICVFEAAITERHTEAGCRGQIIAFARDAGAYDCRSDGAQ